jgi:hypothetical protein
MCCSAAAALQDILIGLSPTGSIGSGAASCFHERAVLALFLSGAGLQGTLPKALAALTALEVLHLGFNPRLTGTWSQDLVLPRLKVLRVEVTLTAHKGQLQCSSTSSMAVLWLRCRGVDSKASTP